MVNDNMTKVNKEPEFLAFLRIIEEETIPDTWEMVAQAIGVHQNTITKWRKTSEFQKALANGIKNTMASMERAGRHDWRMWREKLGLLLKEEREEKLTTNILVIPGELAEKYGIALNAEVGSER